MWWDGSHDWSVAMKGYRLFRKDRTARKWSCPLCERAVGVHGALLKMDEEPTESLWVRIKEQASMGDAVVGSAIGCLIRKTVEEAVCRQLEVSRSQALLLMTDFNHPDTCRAQAIQEVPGDH